MVFWALATVGVYSMEHFQARGQSVSVNYHRLKVGWLPAKLAETCGILSKYSSIPVAAFAGVDSLRSAGICDHMLMAAPRSRSMTSPQASHL